jgi:hypothetical protein
MSALRVRLALTAVPLALSVLLTGCGGDDEPSSDGAAQDSGQEAGQAAGQDSGGSGAPEECAEAFPMAFGEPDLGEVSLLPAGWPEPIDDAVLCSTSGTLEENVESADFATALSEDEVLSSFESALTGVDGYTVSRGDSSGLGRDMLEGTAGDVSFQVTSVPGGYTLTFAQG